jgi:hypothetical protein
MFASTQSHRQRGKTPSRLDQRPDLARSIVKGGV